ncbi:MAG: acetyl-CoA carboxylase biotin carboxyl carrier protein [Candidatus Firestonebacteria bacterium]|nr:acetyl-CoA carboxylase biotin carboxyl carrier protein [Candidatus Firestonebacteria bacterium]
MGTQGEKTSKREGSTPVNLKSLKKIVTIMNRAQLTELNIEQDGIKILLRKGPLASEGVATMVSAAPMVQSVMAAPAPAPIAAAPAAAAAAPAPAAEDANMYTLTSPMVGTFYRAPAPDAAPYAGEGSAVDNNTVVCIIEAMKLMNEIKSDVRGVIKKVLVDNAQAVEFGQPLFLIERKG